MDFLCSHIAGSCSRAKYSLLIAQAVALFCTLLHINYKYLFLIENLKLHFSADGGIVLIYSEISNQFRILRFLTK